MVTTYGSTKFRCGYGDVEKIKKFFEKVVDKI